MCFFSWPLKKEKKNEHLFSALCTSTKRREDWAFPQKLELLRAHTHAFLCGQPLFFPVPVSSSSLAENCLGAGTRVCIVSGWLESRWFVSAARPQAMQVRKWWCPWLNRKYMLVVRFSLESCYAGAWLLLLYQEKGKKKATTIGTLCYMWKRTTHFGTICAY